MAQRTIVILGGALAGPTAAARAREVDEHARILLVERNRRVSYALCGLTYYLSGEVSSIEDLDRERAEFFESVYNIEVRTETEATAIDAAKQTVTLRSGRGVETVAYDSLVVALGAASLLPAGAPAGAENLVTFRTLDDLEKIKRTLDGGHPELSLRAGGRRVAVIGGGIMGLEAADGLIRGGAEVTVVERESRILGQFGPRVAAAARRTLEQRARLLTGVRVESFESAGAKITALRLSGGDDRGGGPAGHPPGGGGHPERAGERLETDLVLSVIGLVPRTDLFKKAGARLAGDGTLVVDERTATSLPGVYACGVCISVPQVITGRPLWWAQGALADKTAQVAGANAAGGNARLSPALGSVLLRVLETTVGRTGLSQAEAAAHLGSDQVTVTTVRAPSHERYYPLAKAVTLQLCWSRRDGRVLGVEAFGASGAGGAIGAGGGSAGVDKRIDTAAAAIAAGLSVEQLASLDFGYAPPYSAARDALNAAATVAAQEHAGLGRSIEPEELERRRRDIQVVDVRTGGLHKTAPVPGSVAIPLAALRRRFGELDASRPVVTVSDTGRRGWLAARLLSQRGFSNVMNLAGGLKAWSLAGLSKGADQ